MIHLYISQRDFEKLKKNKTGAFATSTRIEIETIINDFLTNKSYFNFIEITTEFLKRNNIKIERLNSSKADVCNYQSVQSSKIRNLLNYEEILKTYIEANKILKDKELFIVPQNASNKYYPQLQPFPPFPVSTKRQIGEISNSQNKTEEISDKKVKVPEGNDDVPSFPFWQSRPLTFEQALKNFMEEIEEEIKEQGGLHGSEDTLDLIDLHVLYQNDDKKGVKTKLEEMAKTRVFRSWNYSQLMLALNNEKDSLSPLFKY